MSNSLQYTLSLSLSLSLCVCVLCVQWHVHTNKELLKQLVIRFYFFTNWTTISNHRSFRAYMAKNKMELQEAAVNNVLFWLSLSDALCFALVASQYNTCYVQHAHVIYIHAAESIARLQRTQLREDMKWTGKATWQKYKHTALWQTLRRKQLIAPAIHKPNRKHLNIPNAQQLVLMSEWFDEHMHTKQTVASAIHARL